ncbi:MAG: RNA-directed DNA polymerase [Clostridium paraputrificum]|uniref:RNA-directed DNA polymerase n=1 Tax=Clostridium paraputrificum TaxID=29363 RepID=UPI00189DC5FB|nr:RNA-directed DNA polymerase [Clostridium paraputrificum]
MNKNKGIERNRLDYLLTDIMPVEVSELFSFNQFYNYLILHEKELKSIIDDLYKSKAKNNSVMFQKAWATMPLKYNVVKGVSSKRELNLIQPLSALNLYLFIECYQKEILRNLEDNAVFSLRYHKKNTDLYYKKKVKKISHYFESTSKKINRGVLQQTGAYYKIHKFNSVSSFTNSRIWKHSNLKYSYFAKIDYKACFDSIYSHAYKWIIEKNVIDSKSAKNSNLFITIDRVLQNINGRSSNGLIVGPEFSRMIAELLLQYIDLDIKSILLSYDKHLHKDYSVFRYVDDVYIFANTPQDIDLVIQSFEKASSSYLLRLNELKLYKSETPVLLNKWISKTRELADRISNLFYNKNEAKNQGDSLAYLLKDGYISLERLESDFNYLLNEFENDKRYIVSFMLSTLLNNISKKKDGYNLFKSDNTSRAFIILELAMYIYSYCTCFEHSQKLISMIVYMDDELEFKNNELNHKKLQTLLRRYAFIFEKGNLNDLCNWFLFFYEYKFSLTHNSEMIIESKLIEEENPILLANYLIYSRYYTPYFQEMLKKIEFIINNQLDRIVSNEIMLHREFWYVIIFNNCPYLSSGLKMKLGKYIEDIRQTNPDSPGKKLTNIICDFMKQSNLNQFFCWGYYNFSTSRQIAYRTYQRTVFKQYKNKRSIEMYGSLDT